jgi:hypothetical protein
MAKVMLWLASLGIGGAVYLLVWIVLDTIEDVRWNREHGI